MAKLNIEEGKWGDDHQVHLRKVIAKIYTSHGDIAIVTARLPSGCYLIERHARGRVKFAFERKANVSAVLLF